MSGLHLTFLFLLFSLFGKAQNELGKYLEFADEQYQKGDYVYALGYYEKALELDSNSVAILWKYAETLRAYKDYYRAALYYEKVYKKEDAVIYPNSLLYWALMVKQTGNYTQAIELFKRAKKKYTKDKKSYNYRKSKRELESCLWAQTAVKDTSNLEKLTLPTGLNTVNSEFGHTIIGDRFIFSSLRPDSAGMYEEIYDPLYTNQLYQLPVMDSTDVHASRIASLEAAGYHTGNGSLSPDGKRFYFSRCTGQGAGFNCQIYVAYFDGSKWSHPDVLGELINEPGANTTMPFVSRFGQDETLFFASNKADGEGGMDLYYCTLKNDGNQFGKVRAVPHVNTPDDELAPWYNPEEKRLYFSSSWWDGFGGQDVFYSAYTSGTFEDPVNAGIPVNSAANDLYYFRKTDSIFVSSNRLGVLYSKNPTCCSDVFAFTPPVVPVPETKKETLADLNKRLPVTLYFHNDIPDPRSRETTTKVNYSDSYQDYLAMLPEYKKEYAKGLQGERVSEAEEDIESFFTEYVEKGMKDLTLFKALLLEELQKGYRIRLNVRGFASPLAKTEYNVALTQRRIQSLINHLRVSDQGAFAPYLDGTALNGGKLEVTGVPFGEYTADQITSDNPNDLKNSVFSRAAARERKIEIQSVSYMDTDSLFFLTEVAPTSLVLGKIGMQTSFNRTFTIFNSGGLPLKIVRTETRDSLFTMSYPAVIGAQNRIHISVVPSRKLPQGIFSVPLDVYFEGYEKPLRIMILGEGI